MSRRPSQRHETSDRVSSASTSWTRRASCSPRLVFRRARLPSSSAVSAPSRRSSVVLVKSSRASRRVFLSNETSRCSSRPIKSCLVVSVVLDIVNDGVFVGHSAPRHSPVVVVRERKMVRRRDGEDARTQGWRTRVKKNLTLARQRGSKSSPGKDAPVSQRVGAPLAG